MKTLDWEWLNQPGSVAHSEWYFLGAMGVVILLAFNRATLVRLLTPVETLVHESAHALVAFAVGFKVTGIEVRADGSGLTSMYVKPGVRSWLVTMSGYPGGAVVGSIMATVGAGVDSPRLAVAGAIPVALLLFIKSRSLFSLIAWGQVLAVAVPLMVWGSPALVGTALVVVGGVLCALSLEKAVDIAFRFIPRRGVADGSQDWEVLPGPGVLWLMFFVGVCVALPLFTFATLATV